MLALSILIGLRTRATWKTSRMSIMVPIIFFERGDVCDSALVLRMFQDHKIDSVVNLAAESNVDWEPRSSSEQMFSALRCSLKLPSSTISRESFRFQPMKSTVHLLERDGLQS